MVISDKRFFVILKDSYLPVDITQQIVSAAKEILNNALYCCRKHEIHSSTLG